MLIVMLTLVARMASAQTPAIPRVEFDDAIQRAVTNNPTVAQTAVAIPRAEALVAQARALTRPTVNGTFSNTTLDGARGFDGGITQPQNQSTLGGDVTIPILNLTRRAAVPQARDQVEVAQLSTATVRRDIAVATAQAYLAVIAARRQVDVDQRALDAAWRARRLRAETGAGRQRQPVERAPGGRKRVDRGHAD